MCVCVCVCVRARAPVNVCVCPCEVISNVAGVSVRARLGLVRVKVCSVLVS